MNIKKKLVNWHNVIGWWGATAIFIWAISGISHPLMSWFGPSSKQFFPPSIPVASIDMQQVDQLLTAQNLQNAKIVKVVPSQNGPALQITRDEKEGRDYIDLSSGKLIDNQDKYQAIWLANYYTGKTENEVASVTQVTEFNMEYPWVNRLLPVYRVQYSGSENLVAFIYTETSALAGLSNDFKRGMQNVFQLLHTFKWLNGVEYGRVIIIGLFMLTILAFCVTGLALVFALKHRKIKSSERRYHRWGAYVLWLPLLAWSASGFYHLLQSSLVMPVSGMRILDSNFDKINAAPTYVDAGLNNGMTETLFENILKPDQHINALSLLSDENYGWFYRLSISTVAPREAVSKRQKYAGRPSEKSSVYISKHNGQTISDLNDQSHVLSLVSKYYEMKQVNMPAIQSSHLVTRFGPEYDFRNKRLPVWKVVLEDEAGTFLFVDPKTGIIVDQSRSIDRVERWSFSILHKWNHLSPFIGRFARDVGIVLCLLLILAMSVFGVIMLVKTRKRKRTALASSVSPVSESGEGGVPVEQIDPSSA